MAALYGGARWASAASALPENDEGEWTLAADTWARALSGVSEVQIAEGLRACLASADEYVPTPMLFRARCLGIPSLTAVRWMLRTRPGDLPTAFVRLTWSLLDAYAFARADQRGAERMISDAYRLASEHVMRGGAMPAEPVALVEAMGSVREPASDDTARASLAKLVAVFGEAVAT